MTAAEQKKAKILLVVLLVAGVVWYFVLWGQPASTAPIPGVPTAPRARSGAPATSNPQALTGEGVIRTDLLPDSAGGSAAGTTNLFQYRPRPEPPRPVLTPPPQVTTTPYVAPIVNRPQQTIPSIPPFRQFRYESVVKGHTTGKLTAFLSDGNAGVTYPVSEGEVLLGQYKITRLTDTMIEIEDLFQNGRRQSFPKVQQ